MRFHFKLLLLTLTLAFFAFARSPLEARDIPNSLLWKVSGNHLSKPSYFYGTMHLLCKEDVYISNELDSIMKTASQVFFEVNLSDVSQLFSAFGHLKMKNDTTLKDLLSPEEYKSLKQMLSEKVPFSFEMFESFKPLFISAMLDMHTAGCNETVGLEMVFMERVHQYGVPISGLETIAYQASLFDEIPYQWQAKQLYNLLTTQNDSIGSVSFSELSKAYADQDLESLFRLSMADSTENSDLMNLLLDKRNVNWVAQFDSIAANGSVLFCVGAGHLPGPKGVLQLLREKGYQVEAVLNTKPNVKIGK